MRRLDRLPERMNFENALHHFTKCFEVNEYNTNKLRTSNSPVLKIQSFNNCRQAEKAQAESAGNLEKTLYLNIGSRVMLRRNILTSKGLVNGAIRAVTDIVVRPDQPEMPLCIMVRFDNYSGQTVNGSVPIAPVEASWTSRGYECKRIQFPLMLAFAITIHKSQGLTLEQVVVELGEHESSLGMSYVALSRVKTLNGLALINAYDFSRFSRISSLLALQQRKNEETRLISISL